LSAPFHRSLLALDRDVRGRSFALVVGASLLLAAWLLWFALARVTIHTESRSARLVRDRSVYPVEAPLSGQVVSVEVALESEVRVGQLLLVLDSRTEELELEEARRRFTALGSQVDLLGSQIETGEHGLDDLREGGRAALAAAEASLRTLEIDVELAGEYAKRIEQLHASGGASTFDLSRARIELRKAESSVEQQRHELTRQEFDLRRLESDRSAALDALRRDLRAHEDERETEAAAIARLEHDVERHRVRAAAAGRIGELAPLAPGAFVEAGERLGAIVSEGELSVVAEFSPRDALGRLDRGQTARLRFDGFPWSRYGTQAARVERVGQEARDGVVQVELSLLDRGDCRVPLQHGLTCSAEVEIERITPAELVLRTAGRRLSAPRSDAAPR
jgi:multidrug resistance efflux pump